MLFSGGGPLVGSLNVSAISSVLLQGLGKFCQHIMDRRDLISVLNFISWESCIQHISIEIDLLQNITQFDSNYNSHLVVLKISIPEGPFLWWVIEAFHENLQRWCITIFVNTHSWLILVLNNEQQDLNGTLQFYSTMKLLIIIYYRPQTKLHKVMFLHLSVSHSVHRGECLSQCMLGYTHTPLLGRQTPHLADPCRLGGRPPARCVLGYTVPSACWDRHGYCCGWYASYWNAFLF